MIAFRVSVNGKPECLAGIEGRGVVHVNLCWAHQAEKNTMFLPEEERAGFLRETTTLYVGGLSSGEQSPDQIINWLNTDLSPGDMISINVVDTEAADSPSETRPIETAPPANVEADKNYVRRICKEWGWKITEPASMESTIE